MNHPPKVYIIVLTYNGWKDTIECLESVLKLDYPNYQVVVVDNHSTDGTIERLTEWAEGRLHFEANFPATEVEVLVKPYVSKPVPFIIYTQEQIEQSPTIAADRCPVVIIKAKDNLGFSFGNNRGLNYALKRGDADYVWILNNDTVVPPDTLSRLVERAQELKAAGQKVGILGNKMLFYYDPQTIQGLGTVYNKWVGFGYHVGAFEKDAGQYDRAINFDCTIGASMLVRMDFVKDVGLMNEEYFLYYEELDWTLRGKQKGWQTDYCWKAKVYHKEGGFCGTAQKGKARSVFSDYYGLRNRSIFTRKFYPYALPAIYLGFSGVFLNRIRRGQWGRLKLAWRAMTGQLDLRFKNDYDQ